VTKRDDGRWSDGRWKKARWAASSGKCEATIRNLAVHVHDDMNKANTVHLTPGYELIDIDFRKNANDRGVTEREKEENLSEALAHLTNARLMLSGVLQLLETVRSHRGTLILSPPGSFFRTICEFVFSKKTLEQVVNPIIADMQIEYCAALAAQQPYKAAWVCVRGYWSFAKAIGLYSILKAAVEMWRKVTSASRTSGKLPCSEKPRIVTCRTSLVKQMSETFRLSSIPVPGFPVFGFYVTNVA